MFGIYCRRWGVPLIDGGTVRLPRLIGQSRALDMILTGRAVDAPRPAVGLANRLVPAGQALSAALELAAQIAAFPQRCLRSDRASLLAQAGMPLRVTHVRPSEFAAGLLTLRSGRDGGRREALRHEGAGCHWCFDGG